MLFSSCDSFSNNEKNKGDKMDPFYKNKGGFDRPRVPLIKPYELLKVSAGEWWMELLTTDVSLSIHNIKGVNVSKGKILLHSKGGTDIRFKQYKEAWFIIDVSGKKEKPFLDYKDYADSLQKLKIVDTILESPDVLYEDFYKTGNVKWKQ